MRALEHIGKKFFCVTTWKIVIFRPMLAVLAMFLYVSAPVHANDTCKVKNESNGFKYSDLGTAILAASPGDTIKVIGTCVGNFTIDKDLNLEGADDGTLDGGLTGTVLRISNNITVTITDLTIQNGRAIAPFPDGGGISSEAQLILKNVKVIKNSAEQNGGGIFLLGGINLFIDCDISHNAAANDGGGIFLEESHLTLVHNEVEKNLASTNGGGLGSVDGIVTIHHSTFSENSAETGGGIYQEGSQLALVDSILIKNSALINGGGSYNAFSDFDVIHSTVDKNKANANGGAIYNAGTSIANIIKSTVKKNQAGTDGGGIFDEAGATLHLTKTDVEDNRPNDMSYQ